MARWFAGAAADAEHLDPALLEGRTRRHVALGRQAVARGQLKDGPRAAWRARGLEMLTTYDVLMLPVLARPPLEAKRWGDSSWATNLAVNTGYAPFAAAWNLAGFPAMSVPAGVHPDAGTPMSVQLFARPGRESLLLSVARSLETLRPWQRLAPAYT